MCKKSYTGINIQYPISQMIINKEKIIETRTYPLPSKYLNKEMALIETPGKSGTFKSRVIGIIKFTNSFQYKSKKEFYSDIKKHQVDKNSLWAWTQGDKWGWEVEIVKILSHPIEVTKKKGIRYTLGIQV